MGNGDTRVWGRLNTGGDTTVGGKLNILGDVPEADPHVAGCLWRIGTALQISMG